MPRLRQVSRSERPRRAATMARALRLEFDDREDAIVEVAATEGVAARDIGADISGTEA